MRDIGVCSATHVGQLTAQPGTYALILRSRSRATAGIGRRLQLKIEPGYYVYVGSARGPGGLRARLTRHCRAEKRHHWHIDYLSPYANPVSVWYRAGEGQAEHGWAATLSEMGGLTVLAGFGCSDCRCRSHLFHSATLPAVECFSPPVL